MRHESASARRRRTQGTVTRAEDPGLHFGPTAPYAPLAPGLTARLIDAALTLLEETGVVFDPDSEAPALFAAAGCEVATDGVVKPDRALGKL